MHAGICSLLGLNHPVEQEGSPESIPLDSPAKALGSRTPTGANVGMSAGRAPGMPMTFWAVVSLQRPLPGDGLQVRQQVPLPLSLRELQVRLQNLRQGRVPLPGPHQPQQQPGERARPVRLLLPAVSLSQPGQPPGEQGQGGERQSFLCPLEVSLLQTLGGTLSAPGELGQGFGSMLSG